MSGRLLTFSQYLGGADNVKIIEMFPSTSKTFKYNFGVDVGLWTFSSHYQSLLLDKVTYDRNTGEPNFTETNILGYWPERDGNSGYDSQGLLPKLGGKPSPDVTVTDSGGGQVFFNIAPDRYTGQLFPNARENVVITVVSLTWAMASPEQGVSGTTESHRWGIIERYLPGDHTPGDPALDQLFIPYGTGAVNNITVQYTGNPSEQADFIYDSVFRYTDNDQAVDGASLGKGLSVGLSWRENITQPDSGLIAVGSGYRPGDTITVSDESLGNGGSGETLITIVSTG
jgi:hypothetical protein